MLIIKGWCLETDWCFDWSCSNYSFQQGI